jgi:uncharacterized protein (DUF697 family)
MNIDESLIEEAISSRTAAIVPVHYAGVSCEMDTMLEIARSKGIAIIEDAAQGMMSTYKGKALGTLGHMAAYSFHETKNFTSGFITGLGGVIALPIAIPSALAASWVLQARMAGAIAKIYGHDLRLDRVRTLILLSLAGDVAREAMQGTGIRIGNKLTERAIAQVPGRALVEINKRIGVRLLTKAGERSFINLSKAVPIVGGVVGGAFDAVVCRAVGRTAKALFRPSAGWPAIGSAAPERLLTKTE